MAKDYIPKDHLEFDAWFHNFVTKLEKLGPEKLERACFR
jgi:hypothetical protein